MPDRDAATVQAWLSAHPEITVIVRDRGGTFHAILRERTPKALEPWLADADGGPLASFVTGLRADLAAVEAALLEPWSSGPVEGTINKLKLLKRQMYGRANIDLLEARLMGAA